MGLVLGGGGTEGGIFEAYESRHLPGPKKYATQLLGGLLFGGSGPVFYVLLGSRLLSVWLSFSGLRNFPRRIL